MKQIHEAVQTLESDIGFWRPSWIFIKELKKRKKKLRAYIKNTIFYYNNHTKN